ncbi:hypothetical protein [Sideroxydans sp. CL21]|nr:hypothetical protein [Sideroxydans sp. CL21]
MITKLALKNSNVKVLAVFAILCLGACGGGIASGSATATPPTGTTPAAPVATGSTPLGNPPDLTPPLTNSFTATTSRTTGVAPLSVFFDATATTSSLTTKPFHKLQYTWDFGDPAGSPVNGTTWANGSTPGVSSRNAATGAVAGHVYENIGTFTPKLTVYDGLTSYSVTTLPSITVTDPATVFSTNTICIAATSTPIAGNNGCPPGATVLQQSAFDTAMKTATGSNGCGTGVICKRILFKRGDSFSQSVSFNLYINGPGIIGSYGTGATPVITGTMDDSQLLFGKLQYPSVNSCSNPGSCIGGVLADWRVMDLNFIGMATGGTIASSTSAVNMAGQFNNLTFLRLSMSGQRAAFGNGDQGLDLYNNTGWCCHNIWTGITLQDSTIFNPQVGTVGNTATYSYGVYMSGDRVFFSGNSIDLGGTALTTESHVVRFTYLGQAAITNNTLAHPGPTEQNIKLMAPGFPAAWGGAGDIDPNPWCPTAAGCPAVDIAGLGKGYTRWVEISDNQFISGSNNYMVAAAPQSQGSDERIRDVVIERNHFAAKNSTVSVALYLDGFDYTVRNNTFDMKVAGGPANAIAFIAEVGGNISVAPDDLMAYNNSYYSGYAIGGNNINFLQLNTTSTTVDVENNLVYAPLSTNGQTSVIYGTPKAGSIVAPNSTTAQMKTVDPLYAVTPPVNPTDFKPGTGSYAIGTGASVPVWTDFFGAPRGAASAVGATYDMGAVNH